MLMDYYGIITLEWERTKSSYSTSDPENYQSEGKDIEGLLPWNVTQDSLA